MPWRGPGSLHLPPQYLFPNATIALIPALAPAGASLSVGRHCTMGQCTSGQLALTGILSLGRQVPTHIHMVHKPPAAPVSQGLGPSLRVRVTALNSKPAFGLIDVAGIVSIFFSVTLIAYVVLFFW